MTITELVANAHCNAKRKGFWEDFEHAKTEDLRNNAIGNRLMLIVSELSEALEALRHNDEDNFKEELADVAIRLGDLCGGLHINLEKEIQKKMKINESRPYKHGKSF